MPRTNCGHLAWSDSTSSLALFLLDLWTRMKPKHICFPTSLIVFNLFWGLWADAFGRLYVLSKGTKLKLGCLTEVWSLLLVVWQPLFTIYNTVSIMDGRESGEGQLMTPRAPLNKRNSLALVDFVRSCYTKLWENAKIFLPKISVPSKCVHAAALSNCFLFIKLVSYTRLLNVHHMVEISNFSRALKKEQIPKEKHMSLSCGFKIQTWGSTSLLLHTYLILLIFVCRIAAKCCFTMYSLNSGLHYLTWVGWTLSPCGFIFY